jgi:hypothetical protein
MDIRFHLDPVTGEPPFRKHGVDENEVEDVLEAPGRTGTSGLSTFPTGIATACLWLQHANSKASPCSRTGDADEGSRYEPE